MKFTNWQQGTPTYIQTSIPQTVQSAQAIQVQPMKFINWQQWTPDYIQTAIPQALQEAQAAIDALCSLDTETLSYTTLIEGLENALECINFPWRLVDHLQKVMDSPELRAIVKPLMIDVSTFQTSVFLNRDLWNQIQTYNQSAEGSALVGVQKRMVEELMADFKDSGVNLESDQRPLLESIEKELIEKTCTYANHVLDATNTWELVIEDASELQGLPEAYIQAAQEAAITKGYGSKSEPRWLFTLREPSMIPFLQYVDSESLRKKMWEAVTAVGSKDPYDNTQLLLDILKLRKQKATLLGYKSFGDLILKRRMVGNPHTALSFVGDLQTHISDKFKNEELALRNYKAKKTQSPVSLLAPWDIAYYQEHYKKELYNLDKEALRPYFALPNVLKGMFDIIHTVFQIEIRERPTHTEVTQTTPKNSVSVWHPDVCFYEVWDKPTGALIGGFYSDLFPRASKTGGAWMGEIASVSYTKDLDLKNQEGLVALMCGNFNAPTKDQPSLLTHAEVETLFHEMGHVLHHMLSEVPVKYLSGTHVAWDFVELPSQIMENWCWQPESLQLFAKHYETQELLSENSIKAMQAARNHLVAHATMRQLSLSKLDLSLHTTDVDLNSETLDTYIRDQLEGYLSELSIQPISIVRRFNHLFSDPIGYAAAYYSYKWAEVLEADAFSRFQKEGILSSKVGLELRERILSKGNTVPAHELFKSFMGREPDAHALLEREDLL